MIKVKKVILRGDDYEECTLEDFHEFTDLEVTGKVHSIVSYDLDDHCLLFDDSDCFIIKMNPYSVQKHEGVCVLETLMDTEDRATLFLAHKDSCFWQGLNYLDLEATLKKNKVVAISLADIETGSYPSIDWVLDRTRLGFISSLDTLIILPIPYQNLNDLYTPLFTHNYTLYRQTGLKYSIYIDRY